MPLPEPFEELSSSPASTTRCGSSSSGCGRVFSYSTSDHMEIDSHPNLRPDLRFSGIILLPDSTTEPSAFYRLKIVND